MNNSLVNASLANLTVHFGGREANAFSSLANLCSVEPSVSNKLVKMSYLSFLCDHMTDEMWRGLEISKNMSGSSTGADIENFWRTKSSEIISNLKADLSIQNIDNVYKKYMALFSDMRNDFTPFVQRMDVGMSGEVAILDSMKFDFLGDEKGSFQKEEKTATIDEKIDMENVATISEIIEPEKKSKKKNDVEPAKVDTPQVKEKVEPENADNTAKEKDPFDELDDAKLDDGEDKVAFLHPLTYVVENFVASDTDGNILNDVKITSDEKSKIIDKVKVGDAEYSIGDKSVVQYREDKITAKKELNSLTVAHKTNRDVELASVITSIISTAEYMKKSKQEPFVLNLNLKTEDFAQKVSSALFDLMNSEFFEGKDGKKTSFDFSGVSEFKFNGVSVSKESFTNAKNLDDFDKVIFGASFADKSGENKKSNDAKNKQFDAGTAKLNSDYLDELPELPPEITPEMMKVLLGGNSK